MRLSLNIPFSAASFGLKLRSRTCLALLDFGSQLRPILVGTSCIAFIGIVACKPASVPLEEAQKTLATFEQQSFVVPPRNIDDLLAVMEAAGDRKPDALKSFERQSIEQPPENATAGELAEFYIKRSQAWLMLGDAEQRRDDAERAAAHEKEASSLSPGLRDRIRSQYANSQFYFGDLPKAIDLYTSADPKSPALHRGLVEVYLRSGDIDKASEAFRVATSDIQGILNTINPESRGAKNARLQQAWMQSYYYFYTGELEKAEAANREALALSGDRSFGRRNRLLGSLINILVLQGRLSEAEATARKRIVDAVDSVGRNNVHTIVAYLGLANVLDASGRFNESAKLRTDILQMADKSGMPADSVIVAKARFLLAESASIKKEWHRASELFAATKKALGNNFKYFYGLAENSAAYILTLAMRGDSTEAIRIARDSYVRNRRILGSRNYQTAEMGAVLAYSYARKGDQQRALALFQESVPDLIESSQWSDNNLVRTKKSGREVIRSLLLNAYVELLSEDGQFAKAFSIAAISGSGSVQRALTAASARTKIQNPALNQLIRSIQDANIRIATFSGLLSDAVSRPPGEQNVTAIETLQDQLFQLRRDRNQALESIRERFPKFASLSSPENIQPSDIQAALAPTESFLLLHTAKDATYVWAVSHTRDVVFHKANMGTKEVKKLVAELRSALDPKASRLRDIPVFNVKAAHRLYQQLLEPVAAAWSRASDIIVVTHGPLRTLPFSVLVRNEEDLGSRRAPLFSRYRNVDWLARSHSISVLPAASSLLALRKSKVRSAIRRPFLGIGDPYFSKTQAEAGRKTDNNSSVTANRTFSSSVAEATPSFRALSYSFNLLNRANLSMLARLPDTRDEILEIAQTLGANLNEDVLIGQAANEDAVKSLNLSSYRVIAFATHGLVAGDLDGLEEPALALSAPEVSGGAQDGLLTMSEILSLNLDADWIILSACNTAAGEIEGSDPFSGLGRAFFYSGARALLLSSWPVETRSAKYLTTSLFRHQKEAPNASGAEVLRLSMLELIDEREYTDSKTNRVVFSYAHPIFWAPFSVVGDGSATKSRPTIN